ncbi:hypothetical protein B1R32_1032 [Abditibacterium utsteinense]|uniref:Uncharacterized protein n=1 Tax=Abditibacterium utsteinense TaxID=1960156 RepID=A0A2S8SVA5_9BACT|nr:hypothetical protein [Abditibacterium utsteinense]PQV64735.1 hypothetical protein B1R32_1032 [Abditibacterium utsteinense]
MLEFLDSIDVEQPFFYLQPCTRCLKCEKPLMPRKQRKKQQDGRNFWRCETWKCDEKANVGLGAKNQVTMKIVWSERHEQASSHGTSLDFVGVEPQLISFLIDDGWHGFVDIVEEGQQIHEAAFIEFLDPPIRHDEGFASLLAAILHFRKHWDPNNILWGGQPWERRLLSSADDLMEALLSDPNSRKFQTFDANHTLR